MRLLNTTGLNTVWPNLCLSACYGCTVGLLWFQQILPNKYSTLVSLLIMNYLKTNQLLLHHLSPFFRLVCEQNLLLKTLQSNWYHGAICEIAAGIGYHFPMENPGHLGRSSSGRWYASFGGSLKVRKIRLLKSELPTCLYSDQLGTFNSEQVARWTESIFFVLNLNKIHLI